MGGGTCRKGRKVVPSCELATACQGVSRREGEEERGRVEGHPSQHKPNSPNSQLP